MTTDLVPKTAFAEVKLRRGTVRVAGMTKGSGMIQPLMATTLGFVMTDALIPAGAAARHAEARRGAQLQPHLGGWRHLHQRHAAAAGQRRFGRAARSQGNGRWWKRRSRTSWSRWRSRSRAMAKARGSSSPSWSPARADQRRRGADRARHRQFAAGEDGDRRLRPELGPHPLRRRQCRAWPSIRRRPTSTCRVCAVCQGGLAAPFSEQELKTKLDAADCEIRVGDSREGKGRSALLDLRPHRRLHPHQRQLPDLT